MVLLDVGLPGRGGIDVLRQLKQERPKLPVLMLSIHPPDQYAVRALKAGASGYLTKDVATDELIRALRAVTGGRRYVTSAVAEQLADDLERPSGPPLHDALSDREFEVLGMLGSGKSVSQIAEALHPQLQHDQHVSRAHPVEARPEDRCRHHPLRAQARAGGMTTAALVVRTRDKHFSETVTEQSCQHQ